MAVERFLLDIDAHHIIVRRIITSEYDKDFLERLVEEEVDGLYGGKMYPNMKIISVTAFICSGCPRALPLDMYGTDVLYEIVIVPKHGKRLEDVIKPFVQDMLEEDNIKGRGFNTETIIYMSGKASYDRDYEMDMLKDKCKDMMKDSDKK